MFAQNGQMDNWSFVNFLLNDFSNHIVIYYLELQSISTDFTLHYSLFL